MIRLHGPGWSVDVPSVLEVDVPVSRDAATGLGVAQPATRRIGLIGALSGLDFGPGSYEGNRAFFGGGLVFRIPWDPTRDDASLSVTGELHVYPGRELEGMIDSLPIDASGRCTIECERESVTRGDRTLELVTAHQLRASL